MKKLVTPILVGLGLAAGCAADETIPDHRTDSGRALSLDGVTAFAWVPDSNPSYAFIHQTGQFTVEAWVRLSDPDGDRLYSIVGNTFTNQDRGFFFGFENRTGVGQQQLRFHISRGVSVINAYSDVGSITDSEWHHVAAVGNSSTISFYVDGVMVGSAGTMINLGTGDSTRVLRIGDIYSADPNVWQFFGQIDELRIWSVVRSEEDLNETKDGPLGSMYTDTDDEGLAGYWKFDSLSNLGTGIPNEADSRDESVNERHCEMVSGAELGPSEAY